MIYFDFFGVIAKPVYYTIIHRIIPESEREHWVKRLDELDLGVLSEPDLVQQLADKAGIPAITVQKMADDSFEINTDLLKFIFDELKPNYHIGLLTNIPKNMLSRMMGAKLDLFDIQVVSSEVGCIKPDKKIFDIAIQKAEVSPSEILLIDDSAKNISQAISQGMSGIIYIDFPGFLKELKQLIPLSM